VKITNPSEMNTKKFWEIIKIGREAADSHNGEFHDKLDKMHASVKKQLKKLTPDAIVVWYEIFDKKEDDLYDADLWFITGGSDDGFAYARRWIISKGEKVYNETKKNPKALPKVAPDYNGASFEGLPYVAIEAFEELTEGDFYQFSSRLYEARGSVKKRCAVLDELREWKIPKKIRWQVGDVFAIRLIDITYMFAQILKSADKGQLFSNSPTCALFELRKEEAKVTRKELLCSRVIFKIITGDTNITRGEHPILFNTKPITSPKGVAKGTHHGYGTLQEMGNVYYGLKPWNVSFGDENYYDGLLCDGITRPDTAVVLNKKEQEKYYNYEYGNEEEEWDDSNIVEEKYGVDDELV